MITEKRAFTLIEVMVVLSILAIIAILGYNFFGSTMKEAKNAAVIHQLLKDAHAYSMAVNRYEQDTGEFFRDGLAPAYVTDASFDVLVDNGYLPHVPLRDPKYFKWEYQVYTNAHGFFPGRNKNGWLNVSSFEYLEEMCEDFNEKHASFGRKIWTFLADGAIPTDTESKLCYRTDVNTPITYAFLL